MHLVFKKKILIQFCFPENTSFSFFPFILAFVFVPLKSQFSRIRILSSTFFVELKQVVVLSRCEMFWNFCRQQTFFLTVSMSTFFLSFSVFLSFCLTVYFCLSYFNSFAITFCLPVCSFHFSFYFLPWKKKQKLHIHFDNAAKPTRLQRWRNIEFLEKKEKVTRKREK
jgi:hypothetical protein